MDAQLARQRGDVAAVLGQAGDQGVALALIVIAGDRRRDRGRIAALIAVRWVARSVVARVELAGARAGATVVLTRSDAASFSAPRVSPDGKYVAVVKVERPLEYLLVTPPGRVRDGGATSVP